MRPAVVGGHAERLVGTVGVPAGLSLGPLSPRGAPGWEAGGSGPALAAVDGCRAEGREVGHSVEGGSWRSGRRTRDTREAQPEGHSPPSDKSWFTGKR